MVLLLYVMFYINVIVVAGCVLYIIMILVMASIAF